MSCAKQTVEALISVHKSGEFFGYYGSNSCATPQKICPRDTQGFLTGEGYHLCKEVCNQGAHAEINAIHNMIDNAKDFNYRPNSMMLYLTGHTYACENCIKTLSLVGIKTHQIVDKEMFEKIKGEHNVKYPN